MTAIDSTHTNDGRVALDPFEESFADSPYEQYARLRSADPVHYSDLMCGWVLTRFIDVRTLLRDPSISSDIDNATPTPITVMEQERLEENKPRASKTVVLMDEPDHTRVRRLMSEPFRPREIEKLRDRVSERIHGALDALAEQHGSERFELDLMADFAYPLPVEIFSEMLGVPEEDHPRFRYLSQQIARSIDPILTPEQRDECLAATDEMYDYLAARAEEKRAQPADDLLSKLVHAQDDDGTGFSQDELMSQLITLFLAGHEPVSSLIAAGTLALIRQPDQMAKLRADNSLVHNAVSELARYDGPNQFTRRITTQPTMVGDVELPAGAVIYASLAAANRDPDRWGDTAEEVDIDRPDAAKHLQFGAGAHACLGNHLARLQLEIAFTAIMDRVQDIELADTPVWGSRMFIRGLDSLPITCTISPAPAR